MNQEVWEELASHRVMLNRLSAELNILREKVERNERRHELEQEYAIEASERADTGPGSGPFGPVSNRSLSIVCELAEKAATWKPVQHVTVTRTSTQTPTDTKAQLVYVDHHGQERPL